MSEKLNIRTFTLYILLTICWSNSYGMLSYVQEEDNTEKKEEGEAEKVKTKLGKILEFKNIFHANDSTRLARRYIRWHKKLTRDKKDYRFTIPADNLKDSIPYIKENEITTEILGWYPYWEKDLHKTLDSSLVSTVAYFSYEVDPETGEAKSIHNWDSVAKSIKKLDKKLLLTVTNFGNANNKKFLKNAAAGNVLIENVIKLLDEQNADGVCIDFEGILKSQKHNYNSFIALFSQKLKEQNKDYLVYLTIPAVDWNEYLDFEVLIPAVDQFAIMGYNYYGSTSKVAGPLAPLHSGKLWEPFSLSASVDYYLSKDIDSTNLILVLPFYGNIWNTKTGQKGSKIDKFIGARTYDYIKNEMDKVPEIKTQFDSVSQSSWYSYVISDSTKKNKRQFRQLWFESDASMTAKMNYIKAKGLNGLGVWALGYNKKYDNYWKIVDQTFSTPDVEEDPIIPIYPETITIVIIDSTTNKDSSEAEIDETGGSSRGGGESAGKTSFWEDLSEFNEVLKGLSNYDELLLFVLAFVVFFGGIGLVIAMFKPNTRMYFFSSTAYTIYFTLVLSIFFIVGMRYTDVLDDPSVILLIGFIVGAIALYLVSRYVQKVKRNLP